MSSTTQMLHVCQNRLAEAQANDTEYMMLTKALGPKQTVTSERMRVYSPYKGIKGVMGEVASVSWDGKHVNLRVKRSEVIRYFTKVIASIEQFGWAYD